MTISTTESSIIVSANGVTNSFAFPFIGVSSADITVTSIASNGITTPLLSSQYTLSLNAANPNQLWGVGGTVSFTSPPAIGTTLLIQRTLPLTQSTSVQNQGNYYAQVTEQALDTLCMEIQQVAARTTQFRGIWTTATAYNFGDIVQDGANGASTNNYYICTNANTSGVWATDLANGDWAISVLAVVPSQNYPITLSGAVSGNGTNSIVTGLTYTMAPNSVLTNSSATSGIPTGLSISASNLVGRGSSGNVADISLGSNLAMTGTVLSANLLGLTSSITSNVALNNTSNYFDGPSVAQGTIGTWFASAKATVINTSTACNFAAKLWDGTTVIDSAELSTTAGSVHVVIPLSGILPSPVGNLKVSIKCSDANGTIEFNASGNSKDSTITAFRIA